MWHRFDEGDWWWMAFGMAASWLVVIAATIWLVSLFAVGPQRPPARGARDRAGELLDERLARGEVDLEDYHARRRALGDGR